MGKARDYYLNNRVARIEWRLSVADKCFAGWRLTRSNAEVTQRGGGHTRATTCCSVTSATPRRSRR